MPSLTNRLKLALPLGNEYVNRAALNKIFEDIDRLVMLQGDFDTAKKEIDDNLAKKVSKSGGTLTGDLKFDVSNGNREITATNGTNDLYKWIMRGTNFEFFNQSLNKGIFNYNNTTGMFNVTADTNLLKKTGDTMTDKLWFSGASKGIAWQENSKEVADLIYNGRNIFLRGKPVDGTVYNAVTYDIDKNYFNVQSETNLVKKSGDTITGLITTTDNIRFRAGGERNITWRDGNDTEYIKLYANSGGNRLGLWSTKNNKAVWEYHGDNDIFNVTADTNLLKKTGDTMSGNLTMDNRMQIFFQGTDGKRRAALAVDEKNRFFAWDEQGGKYFFVKNEDGTFTVNADNLVKKSGDTVPGQLIYTKTDPQSFRPAGYNWWLIQAATDGFKFIPSGSVDKDDWQWTKAVWINAQGEVNTQGVKVKGERVLTTSDAEEKIPSRSGKDENGIFTTYEETQEDGKLWKRSVLSSPDADGNYLVRTVTYYKDGVSYKTKIFDLKYDEDGDFVKAVPR